MKTTKITLEIIRDFAGMGKHCFRVAKITGAVCAHTLSKWDGKGEDGPDVNVGDRISREQADDLTGQQRYEVTVVPGK